MGFLDKVRAGVEEAATKAREGIEEVQAKRELNQAYSELGKAAFELIERGELQHAELAAATERVRQAKKELAAVVDPGQAAAASAAEPPPSDQPPAMPS